MCSEEVCLSQPFTSVLKDATHQILKEKKHIHETYTDRTSNLCLGKLQMKHSFPSFLKNYECIVEAERYWRIYHSIRFEFSRSSANVSMIIPKILTTL